MKRVVSPQVSQIYEAVHRAHGVELQLNAGIERFLGEERVEGLQLTDGRAIAADLVVVGIGIQPNVALAADAGLQVEDGIVVDDRCRTSDPDIYAVGDCTFHPNALIGRSLRLESVHNALEQARTAAANACGEDLRYSDIPWFWSDQYDLKLQIAGLSQGYDRVVVRGRPAERTFAAFYLRDGALLAVDAIGRPMEFMASRQLIAGGARPDPAQLEDPDVSMKAIVDVHRNQER
jgi:3-phenylpropionate/trans-cinnamate dioxygenase ferredoxin reductase subunit